jgi:hypothetical protein
MDVTIESEEQTRQRLLRVLAAAEVQWLTGEYAFEEHGALPSADSDLSTALAIVRDGDQWSVLKQAGPEVRERFRVFCCHFDADIPNSGFVGWLALEFKRTLGTGVFVICGQNSRRGGIFDYWAVPAAAGGQVAHLLASLVDRSRA